MARPLLVLALALAPSSSRAVNISSVLSSYGLTSASFNFTIPSTALSSNDADTWIANHWDLNGSIDWGGANIVFSPDPSTTTATLVRRDSSSTTSASTSKSSTSRSSTSTASSTQSVTSPASTDLAGQPPVLRIEYPQGSYSKRTGGTQFYAQPLVTETYERMLLSYDVWFSSGYAWNMGGKLPGLRGGPDRTGCSGGNETNGTGCFSTRLMWRTSGAGEIYAYIPTNGTTNFCSQSGVICNSDYGTSLSRGSFSFTTGQWQTVWVMVILNQVGTANGVVQLWYNGLQALSYTNLELRSASSIASVGGLFFSTFFGGDNSTWATPTTQYTYFRNMALYAGSGAANGTGSTITNSGARAAMGGAGWEVTVGVVISAVAGVVGLLS